MTAFCLKLGLIGLFLWPVLLLANTAPTIECEKAWSKLLPKNLHRYDFQKDARETANGNEGYDSYKQRVNRKACLKDWTVLVYMAADNDLTTYALWDLYEMEAGFSGSPNGTGSTLQNDVVVELNTRGNNGIRRLHLFQTPENYETKTKEFFDTRSERDIRSPVVELRNEIDGKSEQQRFSEFLDWGIREYPSKQLMVIVWGHGQGWKAIKYSRSKSRFLDAKDVDLGIKENPGSSLGNFGIAFNESSGKGLDIPALRKSLESSARKLGHSIDVYASDACLMQMLEVANEISPSTRFIVGSAQVQSFLGLPYRRFLYELNRGTYRSGGDSAYAIAKGLPKLMKAAMDPKRGSQGRTDKKAIETLTSSALHGEEMKNILLPALKRLGKSLESYLQEDELRAGDIQFVMQSTPAFEGGAQDLGIFLGFLELQLQEEQTRTGKVTQVMESLKRAVVDAKECLDRSVVSYAFGSGYGIDSNSRLIGFIPRAVSLWLPGTPEEYRARRKEFTQSRFYKETKWNGWLDLMYPAQ